MPGAGRRKGLRVIETMRSGSMRHKALALAVLACALAMRLLVPQGWMPVSDGHGLRFVLCSGTGPMEMTMAMPGMASHHDPSGHDRSMQDHPNAFANLGLTLAEPMIVKPLLLAAVALEPKPLTVAIGRGLAAPPPPSTGPPLPL
jgi:hypothetical protein